MYRQTIIFLLLCVLVTGCGEELIGVEIGCEWFEGNNCWKESLAACQTCAHDERFKGTLSLDGSRCSFTDGTEITFNNPVDISNIKDHLWDFEIKKNGTFCMSFSEPNYDKRVLITSLGTYTEQLKNIGVQFTCPDGNNYQVQSANALGTCEDYQNILPGVSIAWDPDIRFSFLGGSDGALQIFTCTAQ